MIYRCSQIYKYDAYHFIDGQPNGSEVACRALKTIVFSIYLALIFV